MRNRKRTKVTEPSAGKKHEPKRGSKHPKPEASPKTASAGIGTDTAGEFLMGTITIEANILKWVNPKDLMAALQRYARQDWGGQKQNAEKNARAIAEALRLNRSDAVTSVGGTYKDRHGEPIEISTSFLNPHTTVSWNPEIPF